MWEHVDFINITRTACELPILDHRVEIRVSSLVMGALAVVCFTMRMASKSLGSQWWADDSLIVVSFVGLSVDPRYEPAGLFAYRFLRLLSLF